MAVRGHDAKRRKLNHRPLVTRTATSEQTAPTAVVSGDLLGHFFDIFHD